jgi:hypothetical protein
MNYEIVWSVVFALILFRLIGDGIDYAAGRIAKYQSDKNFKKLLDELEDALPWQKPSFNLEIGCNDDECDICDEPVAKKPVKRKPVKAKPVRRPVKKAVAKKKTVKKK